MLRYANELLKGGGFVYLVGFDGVEIPKSICDYANVKVVTIFPFLDFPIFLAPLLWMFKFMFMLIQMMGIAINIPHNIRFVFCTDSCYFMEPFIGKIVSKMLNAKLICDIATCEWFDTATGELAKWAIQLADHTITSTHSMEMILKIGGLSPFCIPDIADEAFRPRVTSQCIVDNIYQIPTDSVRVAVTACDDASFIDAFKDIARILSEKRINVTFFMCSQNKLYQRNQSGNLIYPNLSNNYARFIFVPYQYDVYPIVLSSCAFGVCGNGSPHTVDISLSILEMQSCGLPILALRYGCISERVKDGVNGFIFNDAMELRKLLDQILVSRTVDINKMASEDNNRRDWQDKWKKFYCKIAN